MRKRIDAKESKSGISKETRYTKHLWRWSLNARPAFAINTIVNDKGEVTDLVCGNWDTSHQKACDIYGKDHTIQIKEKRDTVIVSCGGFPYDLNMIQAHKALEMASYACKNGGTIIFLAECSDGLGRKDFLNWFDTENLSEIADMLCQKYQVNGQTAWSLLKKSEKFNIKIVTELDKKTTDRMRLKKMVNIEEAIKQIDINSNGYILPFGAKSLLKT